MSLFNNKGELNASTHQEALRQIIKHASMLEELQSSNSSIVQAPGLTDQMREAALERALNSTEGKIALGQAMANPIRKNLDYQGVARRALVVDPLAQGALPIYEKDIDVAAVVISSQGSAPESRVMGDRVTVPTFVISSNPTARFEEIQRRRFNVIDRAQQKARQEVQAQEDGNVFASFDYAGDSTLGGENTAQDVADAGLLKRDLIEVKKEVEKWDNIVSKFFLNISEYNDILNWGSNSGTAAGEIDPVTQREILQTGLRGHIWGADIVVTKMVTPGTIFALADPEFVGVMPIRQDISVIPADEPKRLQLGWVVYEEIGFAVVNPRGVSVGRKSVTVG